MHATAWLPALLCAVSLCLPAAVSAEDDDASERQAETTAELDNLDVPSDQEIDAELSRLRAITADHKASARSDEIHEILKVIGGQLPDDLEPYKEPATDPAELSKIGSISPFAEPPNGDELPAEIELGRNSVYAPRYLSYFQYQWYASDMFSNPLYFEDVNLERYGYTYPFVIQPFMSVGKFSTQLALMPYQMVNNPVRKKVYHLGYYNTGEWAPRLWYQVPFNAKAAAVQAGTLTGMIFLIP